MKGPPLDGQTSGKILDIKPAQPLDFIKIVDMWAAQSKDYNFDAPSISKAKTFVELVWKDSTSIGCSYSKSCGGSTEGASSTTDGFGYMPPARPTPAIRVLICDFDPKGRVFSVDMSTHKANVLPPIA
ncbi:hypothetical protein BGZ83_001070 [Gryganskiella cystojenkinii]|nr:hypothetical protein BGZ83_001070 [Gryganskiella cystojenkinii]